MDQVISINQYAIPSYNMAALKDKLTKLARRAAKLGLPVPVLTELSTERIDEVNEITGLPKRSYLVHHITIETVNVIKVNGWRFIATVGHSEEGNVIRAVGDAKVPQQYRTCTADCDHCHLFRNRKDTYILCKEE